MRFIVKNITGDPNNPDVELRAPKKLYAASENLSNTLIIGPQETVAVSEKGLEDLQSISKYISISGDGIVDKYAPFRRSVDIPANAWTLVDLGRVSSQLTLTTGNEDIKWSFSGLSDAGTAPDPALVSDLLKNENLVISLGNSPRRYLYVFAAQATNLKILVL